MPGVADEESAAAARLIDPTKPSIARVYDATLGGKDNYEVDRELARKSMEIAPHQGDVARANRRWLVRVVRYLADHVKIDQFFDLGSGLPTVQNTHEVAQLHHPENRVVYVDNDPVCSAYGRALLEENEYTQFIAGDVREPEALFEHPDVCRNLDFTRPVGLILCGILHHVDDSEDPVGIMRRYLDAVAPGSYVAITHFWDPAEESPEGHEVAKRLEHAFTTSGFGSGWYRTREQIRALFCDLELVEPGLTEMAHWWPDGPIDPNPPVEMRLVLGGVGRKA